MQSLQKESPKYCPFCGYKFLQGQDSTQGLYNCRQCGQSYLIHPFADPVVDSAEIWMDIPGFYGVYQVSSHLRVRSLDRISSANRRLTGKMMHTYRKGSGGEIYIALSRRGRQKEYNVRTLYENAKTGDEKTGFASGDCTLRKQANKRGEGNLCLK
uniref:NUMOD4 domain-containing protein n=1 Tax=Lachnoclostridium phocaeense TaxID=1871021 RepID=UPI003FA57045